MKTISFKPGKPGKPKQEVPSSFSFLRLARESQLLSPEQLEQLQLLPDGTDLSVLTEQLVETGWLTSYQLKRIMEGQLRGLILGQYRILDELGEGGFGKVYKARHALMNRLAAVKVITSKWVQQEGSRNIFLREVVTATRLVHPNIALAYEANETDGCLWFAMELVDGPNLEDFVAVSQPLPIPFVCTVVQQVAQALQYAHEKGMVHRDIKPANLLLPPHPTLSPRGGEGNKVTLSPSGGEGRVRGTDAIRAVPDGRSGFPEALVKVVDFGLARLFSSEPSQLHTLCPQEGVCIGTPEFMSPEQARDSHKVDIRSDLYSLGCTFYFALTGKLPFRGATPLETVSQHLTTEAEPLQKRRPDVPPEVAEIVRRLMVKKPEGRFGTPLELLEALNFAIRNLGGGASSFRCNPLQHPGGPSGMGTETPHPAAGFAGLEAEHDTLVEQGPEPSRPGGGMKKPASDGARTNDPVAALWREWLTIVEGFVQGRPLAWNENDYKVLHTSLLKELRAQAASASGPASPLYAQLETVVEPWLRLRTIAELDRETLRGLWETCRQLDAELPAPRTSSSFWSILACLLVGIALFGAYLVLTRPG